MEEERNADVCPTEILVELKIDDNFVSQYNNEFKTSLNGHDSKIHLRSKDNVESVRKNGNYEAIVDMSPFRNGDIQDLKSGIKMSTTVKQSVKKLRLKTPSPQSMCRISKEASNVIYNLNSSAIFDENVLLNEEILPIPINFDNFDLDDIDEDHSSIENICETGVTNQKSVTVQTEEIAVNTEMINEDNTVDIPIHHDEIKKVSVNDGVINKDAMFDVSTNPAKPQHSVIKNNNICKLPVQSGFSRNLHDIEKLNESGEISVEFSSVEVNSDSLGSYEFSSSKEGADDVFMIQCNFYENKENIEETETEKINLQENVKTSKIMQKNSFVSKMKKGSRETLKNLSNINPETKIDLVKTSLETSKMMVTPQSKTSIKSKSVILQPPFSGKPELKKTGSVVETKNGLKLISRSNSFQCQSKRELISNLQKPSSIWNTTFSNSFDTKQQNAHSKMKPSFVTPSKRYSICTPLKGAASKSLLTPQLPSHQNLLIPRYTHQLNGTSRLSFSKSWQHSSGSFPCSKVLRPQNQCSLATSKKPDLSLTKLNSAKQEKQSFQKIQTPHFKVPEKNAFSTSSKRRFCSKLSLPSPLPVSQNKHLARALFPSMS